MWYIIFYSVVSLKSTERNTLSSRSKMTSTTDEKITLLLSMGFDNSASIQALQICEGNVERAVESLLSGNFTSGDTTSNSNHIISSNSSLLTMVQSEVSQYSDPRGRSACTAIALTQARKYIGQLSVNSPQRVIITSTLLSESITDGIKLYSALSNNNTSGVEHLSVEDIRAACLGIDNNLMIPSLTLLPNSPRQGIRSRLSSNKHMGLEALLSQCQRDSTEPWIAAVITKTPETVLVILPTRYACQSSDPEFVLIDSHPRPQQLAPHFPSGSYALFHPTLASLVASLEEIFPVTELGDGVPELMQMMYNSFDVYPFQAPC